MPNTESRFSSSVRVTERTRCSSNITVMSISTLVLFTLLSYSDVVHSACVYTHPSGYSLRWLVLGDNVLFKLENSNVSVNEYTGIGFEEGSGRSMDRIIVQLNSSGVNVFELASLRMSSQLRACDNGSLITLSRRYRNRNVQAEFARPIVTNSSDLNDCQTWNFITTPTKVGDGSYYVNSTNSNSVQVCNIAEECDVLKMMNAMTITTSPVPDRSQPRLFGQPKVIAVLSAGRPISSADPTQQFLDVQRLQRRRRNTGYTPTNNIYGYDYNSSPTSPSDAARLVLNPNYAYLNDALSEGYARNYVQAETQYSQSGQIGGFQAYDAVPEQSAILSNEQQNALNYQQIRQSNPGSPGTYNTAAYSSNYYGGALADAPQRAQLQNGFQQSTSNNFIGQSYTPVQSYSPVNQFGSPSSSPAPYQSVVDLKTTRLRDPTAQAFYSDTPSNTNPQSMYYPYRTPTNDQIYYNNNGMSLANTGVYRDNSGVYRDTTINPCSLPDPYWCDYYVRIYMNSSITLSGYDRQTVCQAMVRSLQDSYNGCCHAVQAAGCS